MVLKFRGEKFSVLKDYKMITYGDRAMLEITMEFNSELDNVKLFHCMKPFIF